MLLLLSSEYYPQDGPRMTGFRRLLAKFVSKSMKSLSIVEDPDFRALINFCDPMIQMPSRSTFTSKYLPELYDAASLQLLKEIEEVKHLSLTTDLWTSRNQESFMTITVHYINSRKSCKFIMWPSIQFKYPMKQIYFLKIFLLNK